MPNSHVVADMVQPQVALATLATAFALTGDGRTAAIGGENGTVRLLDLDDGALVVPLEVEDSDGRRLGDLLGGTEAPDR